MNKKARIMLVVSVLFVAILAAGIVIAAPGGKGKAKPACRDGFDNDGDGLVDYPADPGCDDRKDNDEYNAPAEYCGDLICNNGETCGTCEQDCGACPPVCGNNLTESGEQCDDGTDNGVVCSPPYDGSCTYCDLSCSVVNLTGGYCGNNVVEATEACDDGANNGITCTPAYGESCTYCETDCSEINLTGSFCGDAVCDAQEACDTCSADCGACPVADSCEDSDYIYYPFMQGTASGYLDNVYYSYTDYCLDNETLMEYFCDGDYADSDPFNCANNQSQCIGGQCVY